MIYHITKVPEGVVVGFRNFAWAPNTQCSWGLHLSFLVAYIMRTCCLLNGLMFHKPFDCKLMEATLFLGSGGRTSFGWPAPLTPHTWTILIMLRAHGAYISPFLWPAPAHMLLAPMTHVPQTLLIASSWKQPYVSAFHSPAPGPFAWSCLLVLGQISSTASAGRLHLPHTPVCGCSPFGWADGSFNNSSKIYQSCTHVASYLDSCSTIPLIVSSWR